ncbi:MAG TPA: hypothetical protein VK610_10640 [Rhodothermales bacterium]|nr:hypothetical protein [Rhodothermales bacterium]
MAIALMLIGVASCALRVRQALLGEVDVSIHNRGRSTLGDVVLDVNGHAYRVGDIEAENRGLVYLEIPDDPVLELHLTGTSRRSFRLDLDPQPGLRGSIMVFVTEDSLIWARYETFD